MKSLIILLFEMQHMKMVKHEGWKVAWVKDPDSIAEHSLCAAQIWYILAKLEWADPFKVTTILVWHDWPETRIWDLHRVWKYYIKNKKEIEKQIIWDQLQWIDFAKDIQDLFEEYEEWTSLEWIIAKDADYLEQAFQAKIYTECGYKHTQRWIDNIRPVLKTSSAKEILEKLIEENFFEWSKWWWKY